MTKPWEHAKSGEGSASDPLAARFVESISYDTRMYKHDIAGSVAHAKMLHQVGLLSQQELAQITRGLSEIESEITEQGQAWPGWKLDLEDVHMCVEAALIEKVGNAGRKLHTGRSRNDQVALDLKLWLVEARAQLSQRFTDIFSAFIELAQRDGETVMPSYTHLQRAQPIVVGGELMAWLAALDRAHERVLALGEVNTGNPLGSGAIAGSSLPLDRELTAEMLQVGAPTPSSIDATASRDAAIDFVYALSMTTMTLSRWAEQWIIYMSTEFGFLTLDEKYTTGSSMMPQKRNPDMLELIRGRCGNVYGHLVALLTICKGLPIGYNRDLQEDKRHVFAAFDVTMDCLEMAANIVRTARFNSKRIARDLDEGFLDATSLADYLVGKGVAFRTAHQIAGGLVQTCLAGGGSRLSELTVMQMNKACQSAGAGEVVADDVHQWLGAANVVRRYQSAGNSGLSGFRQQLAKWESRLQQANAAESV